VTIADADWQWPNAAAYFGVDAGPPGAAVLVLKV